MKNFKVTFTVEGKAGYYCFIAAETAKVAKALFALDYVLDPYCWLHSKDISRVKARAQK